MAELIDNGDTLRTTQHFGFRHFRFEEKGPFYLNGERLLLRGTHRHEDHAGVGAALTEEMMRTEMQQIKEMGANFIRLGHYQQSGIILRLCDELGLLVWEEIPWCRGGLGGESYKNQARRMLTNMIEQHRNHPSVILWGLGNENDWPGDFQTFEKDSIRAFMGELHDLAHRLDPTRSTAIRRCEFCKDIVDVYSPTIWAGWYGRRFRNYREMETAGINATTRFLHAEWGGDSHAGRHMEVNKETGRKGIDNFDIEAADRNGDWSESYIIRLFDWHLKEQETMPRLTGSLFWTFKDFCHSAAPGQSHPLRQSEGGGATRRHPERELLRLSILLEQQTDAAHLWTLLAGALGVSRASPRKFWSIPTAPKWSCLSTVCRKDGRSATARTFRQQGCAGMCHYEKETTRLPPRAMTASCASTMKLSRSIKPEPGANRQEYF